MDASIAGGIFALVAGIVTLISGRYADKLKESELVVVSGYVIMGIGYVLYIWVDSIIFLFTVQAIIGLGAAVYSPAFDAAYSDHLNKDKGGSQWAAWESAYYFTAAAGALIGGFLATQFGFQILFIIMALLCFSSAGYIYSLKRSVI